MSRFPGFALDNRWIKQQRGPKNRVDPERPYAVVVEKERSKTGIIEDVLTIFLTNHECPFKCLMCDLWKNSTDYSVETVQIVRQIAEAIESFPNTHHIKIYNSGNFFDTKAVPPAAYKQIASLVSPFQSVIIENHPLLIDERCLNFRDSLTTELEVALGLEIVHPEVLAKLNKGMQLSDLEKALDFLHRAGIFTRVFILLRPPFLSEEEGKFWAKKSIDWSFERGVGCCTVIPTRAGNGAMEWLKQNNYYNPPTLDSLEEVLVYGIEQQKGRVFADLWDLELFVSCTKCLEKRRNRLDYMNLNQLIIPPVTCECNRSSYAPS